MAITTIEQIAKQKEEADKEAGRETEELADDHIQGEILADQEEE